MDEDHQNYLSLLDCLFHIEFTWSVKGDENRSADGIHLRLVYHDKYEDNYIYNGPCSVLEMIVALSVRGSEDILWDGENNWTPYLFWTMIDNLGLINNYDGAFNEIYVEQQIGIFLNRNYDENGVGGLFLPPKNLSHFPKSWRKMEIWYQMQNWISDKFV